MRLPNKPLKQTAAPRRYLHRHLLTRRDYHGLARRHLTPLRFLMQPLLNGGTLGGPRLMPQQVVPVAATFLERLLFDTPAVEAVATLSSMWSPRADPELTRFGLSDPEFAVQLCLIYSGEVSNGGHSRFFLNRGGRHVLQTIAALNTTGLADLAPLLRSAVATFPQAHVPVEPDDVETELDNLTPDRQRTLADLDRQAFGLLPSVDPRLLTYLRTTRAEVLLPETPLDARIGRSRV